ILPVFGPGLSRGRSIGRSLPIGKFVEDILIAFNALLTIGTMDSGKKDKDNAEFFEYIFHTHSLRFESAKIQTYWKRKNHLRDDSTQLIICFLNFILSYLRG